MNEERLDQIRKQARAATAAAPGYYGQPVVRPPVWTWEIPIYFFIGGIAGMSAVISLGAALFHHVDLARLSIFISVIGVILSPILLILDLGRPHLFLNMLRVFKPQSAMSMGVWILTFFGACVVPALIAIEFHLPKIIVAPLLVVSALLGVLLATYTGVLIGATTIPAWFTHHRFLPIHFGTAALGSAAALLELLGQRIAPLNAIGFVAAGIETTLAIALLINRRGAADRALHRSTPGALIRIAEILTGPLPLISRATGLVPIAAISFLLGALVSRFGWILAGKISARDPEATFSSQDRHRHFGRSIS